MTADGHRVYMDAVADAFETDIDYAMLVKLYGHDGEAVGRYSPPDCVGTRKTTISGEPDKAHISTSYVERQNLTMRMCMRRYTRLTNGFSKKVWNYACATALYFTYYNYSRPHGSLTIKNQAAKRGVHATTQRRTPAMAAELTDHVWTIEEIWALVKR
jgi:hypothetical protein